MAIRLHYRVSHTDFTPDRSATPFCTSCHVMYASFLSLLPLLCSPRSHVQNKRESGRHNRFQSFLPLDQWQRAEVFTIEPQQVERCEMRISCARGEIVEARRAGFVQTTDLSVNNRVLHPKILSKPCPQSSKSSEDVLVPRDQFALAVLEVGHRPEAVVLQCFCGVRRYVALECRTSY